MLSLSQILDQYPQNLRAFPETLLKEYLQCKILNSIFNNEAADKLAFMGGTALRRCMVDAVSRKTWISTISTWERMSCRLGGYNQERLGVKGLRWRSTRKTESAYRLKIRIPGLLYDTGLTRQAQQKILIQVDTVPQHFDYVPDKPILNKFEVFTQINVVPKNILLAQKIYTATNRKRAKGRDFFDIIFLYGLGALPDWGYLRKNLGVESQPQLREYLLEKTQPLNFSELARD